MKRLHRLSFCLGLLLMTAGCQQETPQSGKGTLTIWWAQWDPAVGLQELGRRFEQETRGSRSGSTKSHGRLTRIRFSSISETTRRILTS
jgi:hypothetical protein